jgi:hypothetical protein
MYRLGGGRIFEEESFAWGWDGKLGGVGVDGYSEVVVSAMGIAPAMGITFGRNEKRFMDMLSVLEERQHRKDEDSVLKPKGWRERKHLECFINFDARANGSSWGKSSASLRV